MATIVINNGTNWVHDVDGVEEIHPTSTEQYPSKIGWPTIAIDYDSSWVADDGSMTTFYHQDFLDHPNGEGNLYLRFVQDPSCAVDEAGTYTMSYDPSVAELVALNAYWITGECGTPMQMQHMTVLIGSEVVQREGYYLCTKVADVNGKQSWTGVDLNTGAYTCHIKWELTSGGLWEIEIGGAVSQSQVNTDLPHPSSIAPWPELSTGDNSVTLWWGDQTGAP